MRKHKDWLKAYLDFTAYSEAPEIFHFWTGVSTIAGALRRRVWIYMKHFEWTPNFYVVFVAPPGVATKSTTINIGMSMLSEVEGVNFGPDSATWQALGKKLMEARELVALDPGNIEGDMEEMSCITMAPGELGTFLDFKDGKLIDTLTSLWDGQRGTFEHSTATQPQILIQNPWINFLSATTPAWLKRHVPEEAIGGGLASRIIFVFGEKKRQLIAYPGLVGNREEHSKMRDDLLHDLGEISSIIGEMRLTPEAIDYGAKWYEEHWMGEIPIHMASERYGGYRARKQTHIHKLAMILSASSRDDRWITEEDLDKAVQIISAMESDMINVFESIGVASTSKLVQEILAFVAAYQSQGLDVNRQMLWRNMMQVMSAQDFQEAIDAAVNAGYLSVSARHSDSYYSIPEEELTARKERFQNAH